MGIVFDIQRCSYHDGPGIRTTVFLKGCGLRCAWCHNPESFRREPQLRYVSRLCIRCGSCAAVCPNGVHQFTDGKHTVDFARCTACGACTAVCGGEALSIVGRELSVEDVMAVVRRDKAFYDASGGGLTVSGGEPTVQGAFLAALLEQAKAEGISVCLESNGYIPQETLERIVGNVDLFLLDFKLTEAEGLTALTGAGGAQWQWVMDRLTALQKPVVLRLPIIPGINDTRAHIAAAVAFRRAHPNIEAIELMPYHSIGAAKWEQLGLRYTLSGLPGVPPETAALWNEWLRELSRD